MIPRLRFKCEDGTEYPNWKTKQLRDVFVERNQAQTISKDTPLLSFTIEKGVIFPEDKKTNKRDFLIKDKENKKFSLTELDDIIYNPSYLKSGAIHRNKLGRGVISPIYGIFYTNENPAFMENIVTNPNYIKKAFKYLEGTVVKMMTLKPRDFLLMKCHIPCLEEQQKIADFLSIVDEVITHSEAEVQNFEQQRKAIMKNVFSQKVRFKREDGSEYPEWEEKILSDICENIVGGGTPTTKKQEYWSGNISWISSSDLENNNIHLLSITRHITQEAINNSTTKIIPKGSVLIVSRVGVGKVAVAPCELCTSQDFTNIINPKCDSSFLAYLLSETMRRKSNGVQGAYIKGITMKEIKKYLLSIPCIEEQKKIADFISAYDDTIKYAKQELYKWKELKKGLMQQMFV